MSNRGLFSVVSLTTLAALAACGGNQPPGPPVPDASTPVVSSTVTDNPGTRSRTWTWTETIRRGECTMENPSLTLHDDGSYIFHAVVHSTDGNDDFTVSFDFLDRDQVLLENLRTNEITYRMETANQRYRWITNRVNESGLAVDANQSRGARLSDISKVNIMAGC